MSNNNIVEHLVCETIGNEPFPEYYQCLRISKRVGTTLCGFRSIGIDPMVHVDRRSLRLSTVRKKKGFSKFCLAEIVRPYVQFEASSGVSVYFVSDKGECALYVNRSRRHQMTRGG